MSFDANGIVCVDINKASFSLAKEDEIKRTAVCEIYSPISFESTGPKAGGVHDARLGPMDSMPRRGEQCVTCGGLEDCPGHLGFIQLALPCFHPLFYGTLLRLLKSTCLLCRRLKIKPDLGTIYLKKFQLVQLGQLGLLEQFETLSVEKSKGRRGGADSIGNASDRQVATRRVLSKLSRAWDEECRKPGGLQNLGEDLSRSATSIESWRRVVREVHEKCDAQACSHCQRSGNRTVRKKSKESAIEVNWSFDKECPVERAVLLKLLDRNEEIAHAGSLAVAQTWGTVKDAEAVQFADDETVRKDHLQLGKRGKSIGSVDLQAYQVLPILRDLYNSNDRPLLDYLIPASRLHSYHFFFMNLCPVSANKFRPMAKSLGFGGGGGKKGEEEGGGGGIMHPRSTALIDVLTSNAKVTFALYSLRHRDKDTALEKLGQLAGGLDSNAPAALARRDKEDVKKSIEEHAGNYSVLHQYSRDLQEKMNMLVDSSKGSVRNPPPAIKQWMEKKGGAIRQKMMGKRVNFAARTTITPDGQINTNEIGIPMPFAMKLTIHENAVPHNVDLLCQLVMNGPKKYPGCNMIVEPSGRRLDLLRRPMTEAQKLMQCKQIRNHVEQQVSEGGMRNPRLLRPFLICRHLRDGDVVVMNRQPSLHRASMMAHFVRVLTGTKCFRLNYANCGSYNADFDGDEMNMHCLQTPTARAEAAYFMNSDCNYNVVKSGEPLRGLIQDHVLGGNFLTVRGTFLSRDLYFNLIYIGVAAFVDKGDRFDIKNQRIVTNQFAAGDPFARSLGVRNIKIKTQPPAIWKPEPLWTGKQVVTAVLKTLVDSIAIDQYGTNADGSPNEEFLKNYKGINLRNGAKTAGDAWNGILDKDKEEQTVVIRHSELLQGVFDKAQFGASSYGLVHLCYELMGPRVAGMLLSVFSRIFSCWLQIRGFSCSSGDFVMTRAGEEAREKLIQRCTAAGTCLQEKFVDAIYSNMHWQESIATGRNLQSKYVQVGTALHRALSDQDRVLSAVRPSLHEAQRQQFLSLTQMSSKLRVDGLLNKDKAYTRVKSKEIPPFWPADPKKPAKSQAVSPWLTQDQRQMFKDFGIVDKSEISSTEIGMKDNGVELREVECVMKTKDADAASSWNLTRYTHTPAASKDWRLVSDRKTVAAEMERILTHFKSMGEANERVRGQILHQLATEPALGLYFPRLAALLGAHKLWPAAGGLPASRGRGVAAEQLAMASAARALRLAPPPAPVGRLAPPLANNAIVLPSGRVVHGVGALRPPKLYHPSWVWSSGEDVNFNSPLRYIARIVQLREKRGLLGASAEKKRPFLLNPSELTRLRMERLIENHFAGRQSLVLNMFDKFFQANMAKLSGKNNDLVSGGVTLYPFPRNGFSSMVTTAAKGSKVNFAMICGMLSQQSLEGKRVPLMISGKSHPAFGKWDLGARAGGLIFDRFLTGLRQPEYFFHCMAGREGLVDTAIKTARSGYLQRCVIKSLEGMAVNYDGSVREGDGSVIQFLYGEDCADVCKMTYLHNIKDLMANPALMQARFASRHMLENPELKPRLAAAERARTARVDRAEKRARKIKLGREYVEKMQLDLAAMKIKLESTATSQTASASASVTKIEKMKEELFDETEEVAEEQTVAAKDAMKLKAMEKELARCVAVLKELEDEEELDKKFPEDPLTKDFSPQSFPGMVSEAFEQSAERQAAKALGDHLISKDMMTAGLVGPEQLESKRLLENERGVATTLGTMLRLKFRSSLAAPGEAVGCLAAQSMGEPATQMTLNTFHLAGHGAANVTLGIPRLREILQTAGDAATPVTYVPVLGDTQAERERNANKLMLGFRKIKLSDVIHAVGVEANQYVQRPSDNMANMPINAGNPEFKRGAVDTRLKYNENVLRKFWGYEATIQFECLDHFARVVPNYPPERIICFTINKVVKDLARTINRLMAVYTVKNSEETFDEDDDALGLAVERFVLERNFRGVLDKKKAQREVFRAAGMGSSVPEPSGDGANDVDLVTGGENTSVFRKGNKKVVRGDGEDEEEVEEEDEALENTDEEKDDSEEDLTDIENIDGEAVLPSDAEDEDKTGGAQKEGGSDQEDETGEGKEEGEGNEDEDMDDAEAETDAEPKSKKNRVKKESAKEGKDEKKDGKKDGKKEGKKGSADVEKIKRLSGKKGLETERKRKVFASIEKWKYDMERRILTCAEHFEDDIEPDELEAEARWEEASKPAFKKKDLNAVLFRYITDIKICTKTWRIVVKWGWPVERCPRRIEFLPYLTKSVQKQTLQATPEVQNARIVSKGDTYTKKVRGGNEGVECELQCEGSNLQWIAQLSDSCADHSRVSTNDLRAMFRYFGVESGRMAIINELARVFSVYGITVDFRHLSLIADAMTHSGKFKAFSRLGMAEHSSPLLQMTFETSIRFLAEGVERGAVDNLRCPAGAIVVGKATPIGTGLCRPLTHLSGLRAR